MMQTFLRSSLRAALRVLFKGVIGRASSLRVQRPWLRLITGVSLRASGTQTEHGTWGVPGLWVRHSNSNETRVILHLHGGGYTLGSPQTHQGLASQLARAARCQVLLPDYRLAPEHPYPAALEDALSAYRSLLDRFKPANIVISGDSAGGGLALCTAIALRDGGQPLPAALVLISPWVDLSLSGESVESRREADPMITREWLDSAGRAYRGAIDAGDPRVSPAAGRRARP